MTWLATAFEFVHVADNGNQLGDDDRMGETFEVVFKSASGTDGRVMQNDLKVNSR